MRLHAAILCCLVGLAACSGSAGVGSRNPADSRSGGTVAVQRVVDGDTLIVVLGGRRTRVRLIGVDTPETVKPNTPVQCFGPAASSHVKSLLAGESVRLVFDRDLLDRFGRTLAYVYRARDNLFVQLDLLRGGFARALRIPPDTAYADEFAAAEQAARSARRGLWGACNY